MFKLHREKRFLISPNINKAFKMQYDVFVNYRGLLQKRLLFKARPVQEIFVSLANQSLNLK